MNSEYNNSTSPDRRSKARRTKGMVTLSCAVLFGTFALTAAPAANAAEAKVGLGSAESYSVLAGQSVTNTGSSIIASNLGTSPGTAISGFPPGLIVGETHNADANASLAQEDLVNAYDDAASRAPTEIVEGDLVGRTLVGGVYKANSSLELNGTLTLDGQGDPSSVWIFQVGSELKTGSASEVRLVNGASACNIYWQVGSSATLGTDSDFKGSIMALTSVTVTTDTVVEGRALARNGSVTLDNNLFLEPDCGATIPEEGQVPVPVPDPTPAPPVDDDGGTVTPPTDDSGVVVPPVDGTTPPADETPVDVPGLVIPEEDLAPEDSPDVTVPVGPEENADLVNSDNQPEELAKTGATSTTILATLGAMLTLGGVFMLFLNSRNNLAVRKS